MKNVQKAIVVLLIIMMITLTSCNMISTSKQANPNANYYTGIKGVDARYQAGSPPRKMYYYEEAGEENEFELFIDVQNNGPSYTKGGLYISGYDPSMIQIKGIDIKKSAVGWDDCSINFGLNQAAVTGNFWKSFTGSFLCDDSGVSGFYDNDKNFGGSISDLGLLFGIPELNDVSIDYGHSQTGNSLSLGFADSFNLKYLNHGAGLLILFSGLSFERYNGREYLLRPNNHDFPGGEFSAEMFEGKIVNWPQGLDRVKNVPFLLTNCYLYTTYSNEMVCIDPDPYDDRTKVCTPRTITSSGQGSPVAITKIAQEGTKKKIIFDIEVQNKKGGQVFDMGYMERCSPYHPSRLTRQQLDKVYITDARIGEQNLKCTPNKGEGVRLMNGIGRIRCEYYIDYQTVKSAYETPLILELSYGYSTTSKTQMEIKRV